MGSQNPTMEQGEDASCQPVGANRGLCFNMCWARETYTLTWVWRDYDVTQYGLRNSRSKLPGVCKAATPEASPMSLGFLTAEHEGEQGVKHWRGGGSGGRSPPERRRRTGGDKGRSPSSPKVPMSERSTAKVQKTRFPRFCTSPKITFKQEQHSKKSSRLTRRLLIQKNPLGIRQTSCASGGAMARGRRGRSIGLEKHAPRLCFAGRNVRAALRRPAA